MMVQSTVSNRNRELPSIGPACPAWHGQLLDSGRLVDQYSDDNKINNIMYSMHYRTAQYEKNVLVYSTMLWNIVILQYFT